MGFAPAPQDPYSWNSPTNDTIVGAKLGCLYYHQGELFMFVLNNSADTDSVAGKLALWDDAGVIGKVTMKATEAGVGGILGTVAKAVGMWCVAVTFAQYGFVKVVGFGVNGSGTNILVTDGGVVQGNPLVCDGGASPTFICDTAVAGEEHAVIGIALADDDATPVVAASLNCLGA